jgi:S-DNA-T family DNA segregation ATPase FtsK/SpoIIIE
MLYNAPGDYLGAVATDQDAAAAYLTQIVAKLTERVPPPEVTPAQLRERSWWTGPEIIVVVDDYDLVAGPGLGNNPLSGLNPYLTQATDLGFHLVMARRVGGASRSLMSDPLVSRLRELGSSGLILPGDPREGVLLGDQRARPGPPGRATLITRQHGPRVIQTVHDSADNNADNGADNGAEFVRSRAQGDE